MKDFPFYNGVPVAVDGRGWAILMASLVVAFAALAWVPLESFPLNFIPALLFVGIPLIALQRVVGPHWRALFGPVGFKQIGQMLLFAVLTIVGSLAVGFVLSRLMTMTSNPVSDSLAAESVAQLMARLLPTIPQLIGEEFLGVLPFLAVLWLCVSRFGLSRRMGIVLGLVVSGLIFGAAHLPTYDWNWGQALLGIGWARVLLTLAYVWTRNLWVSAGAHILNDWTGFLFAFAMSHGPIE
ncbi:CPBP family intramembrane glutamic endopeptidase [Neogemmobacter tilapiae]|uniref:CAAX amino protease n=1 Tax=Neogemmobacter tilapiae TaxID=875041 RepID=A0A918TJC7_9RHOB|nr:type II CAAX endopeptidase family protein [Gemmobacter tilapiae]GHC48621.1 CAAX amino protease [Gemmobacter tilapiae]